MSELTNADFLSAIYRLAEGEYGWTASFLTDPAKAGPADWAGQAWNGKVTQAAAVTGRHEANNYYGVAVMHGQDQRRAKANFVRLAVLLADDVNASDLIGSAPYVLETSPGNFQAGVLLDDDDPDTRDQPLIDALLQAMAANGLVKADRSGNNLVRYARLPVGSNTKRRASGPFKCVMRHAVDGAVYSLADAAATFGLDLDAIRAGLGSAPAGQSPAPKADKADLYRALLHPDPSQRSYHDPLLKISSSLIASGAAPAAVLNHLRGLGEASIPANDNAAELSRHAERYGPELVRMVRSASKFTPAAAVPLSQHLGDWDNGTARPVPLSLRVDTLEDFVGLDLPARKHVISPIIPRKGLAMICAQRGVGKTLCTNGMGLAAARGASFLRWRAEKPSKILLIDGEMPAELLQARAKNMMKGSEPPAPGYFRMISMDRQDLSVSLNLARPDHQALIEAHLEDAELLIVDNISTLVSGGRENDADSWDAMQPWLLNMRRQGVSVLLVAHAGRSEHPRGTSKREDILDTVIHLKRPLDYSATEGARFEVHITKGRGVFGKDAEPFEARLEVRDGADVWTWREISDPQADQVAALTSDGMSVRAIADELKISKSTVNRIQARHREDGVGAPTSNCPAVPGT